VHAGHVGPGLELADILRLHAPAYAEHHALAGFQARAIRAIVACRTAALGGQRYRCPTCGHDEVRYHSCGNRHCPKCQALAKERWAAAQTAQVLPVAYYHVVFTLPHALHAVWPSRGIDALLFACAAQTLLAFARDPKWLGAEPAITAILHTWDQRLRAHHHVHCLVSGGGLDGAGRWINAKPRFLFPVRALSRVFRGKFIAALARGLRAGAFRLPPDRREKDLLAELGRQDWVVYAKVPFAGPAQVLAYLGRYTHRTAIGNQRLVALDNGQVRFRWKDRAHGNTVRIMALPAEDFIHRFLLHVLPRGFQRIRHYGLLANRHKAERLARARAALALPAPEPVAAESVADFAWRVLGLDIHRCPVCKLGRLRLVAALPRERARGPPEHA
jgi:hypothetical protein